MEDRICKEGDETCGEEVQERRIGSESESSYVGAVRNAAACVAGAICLNRYPDGQQRKTKCIPEEREMVLLIGFMIVQNLRKEKIHEQRNGISKA